MYVCHGVDTGNIIFFHCCVAGSNTVGHDLLTTFYSQKNKRSMLYFTEINAKRSRGRR